MFAPILGFFFNNLIFCPREPDRFECFCLFCLCTYLCGGGTIGVQMYVWWPEGDFQIYSFIAFAFYLSLERGSLTKPLNLEFSVWLPWIARWDLWFSYSHFPSAGNTDLCPWPSFLHRCWRSKFVSSCLCGNIYVYMASSCNIELKSRSWGGRLGGQKALLSTLIVM